MLKVLYCGDTEIENTTVHKGFDYYNFTYAIDDSEHLKSALAAAGDIEVDHLGIMDVHPKFPLTVEELNQYDVVILSDVGYNNLTLTPGFRPPHRVPMGPNRVKSIKQYVEEGGGLVMIGGWLSFSGIYGKGNYAGSLVEEVLPVTCSPGIDDRQEVVQGFQPEITDSDHYITQGLPWGETFYILGYNRVEAKADAEVLAVYDDDPLLAIMEVGEGRSAVFTSDVAPHWAGTFVDWAGYAELWQRTMRWVSGEAG